MIKPEDLLDPKTGEPITIPMGPVAQGLRAAVEQAAKAQIPEGKRAAILAVADRDGLRGGVVMKVDKKGNWKFAADAGRQWDGPINGRVVLVGSF